MNATEVILEAFAKVSGDYEVFGIRVMDSEIQEGGRLAVGDEVPASYRWDDGDWTEDRLSGASTILVRSASDIPRAVRAASDYWGDQLTLIAGESREIGQDEGEIIIRNAIVIASVNRVASFIERVKFGS